MARYVPLNVQYLENPKVMAVSPLARLAYVAGLCIAARNESDGCVTLAQLQRECFDFGKIAPLIDELVSAGLFDHDNDDFMIPGFLDWNKSRSELDELREKRSKAGKLGGRPKQDAKQDESNLLDQPKHVAPTDQSTLLEHVKATEQNTTEENTTEENKIEDPLVSASADRQTDSSFSEQFDQLWRLYPRKIKRTEAVKAVKARLAAGVPFEQLLEATQNFAVSRRGQDVSFTMHAPKFYGSTDAYHDYLDGGPGLALEPVSEQPPAPPVVVEPLTPAEIVARDAGLAAEIANAARHQRDAEIEAERKRSRAPS